MRPSRRRKANRIGTPWGVRRHLPAIVMTAAAALLVAALPLIARAQQSRKDIIKATMPGVVMVIAARLDGRRLRPISSGSGTIIASDGSILTNHHVLFDAKTQKLHELFVIGRFRAADREPELVCIGRPSGGRLKPAIDLALIKCDRDLNLKPRLQRGWPTVPVGRSEDIVPGEQILVLGYPGVGGATIQVTEGLLSGWMDEGRGTSKRAYMKTDADITHGNSGGTAIDESGKLVGVPTAYRVTTAKQGEVVVTAGKVGLIRPIEHARDLIDTARAGWTVSEPDGDDNSADGGDSGTSGDGDTASGDDDDGGDDTATAPPAPEPPQDRGVRIRTKVVEAANRRPVPGAIVIVFKPGVRADDVDMNKLEEQAIAWGKTDAEGAVMLNRLIPRGQRYTVGVVARGFKPLVSDGALAVPADAPAELDPWGIVRIERP